MADEVSAVLKQRRSFLTPWFTQSDKNFTVSITKGPFGRSPIPRQWLNLLGLCLEAEWCYVRYIFLARIAKLVAPLIQYFDRR